MTAIVRLLSVTLLAVASTALYTPRDDTDLPNACENGTVVKNETLTLNGNDIQLATFNCDPSALSPVSNLEIGGIIFPIPIIPIFPFPFWPFFPFPPPKPPVKPTKTISSTASSASPTPTSVNVCATSCTDACGSLGVLPPISEDCQTIYNSISLTDGSIAPTFDVLPSHIEQLTFGTCRVFFENFSNTTLTYCWDALSQQASAAGTICFPPTQPVNSAGFCSPTDASWQVGVAHS